MNILGEKFYVNSLLSTFLLEFNKYESLLINIKSYYSLTHYNYDGIMWTFSLNFVKAFITVTVKPKLKKKIWLIFLRLIKMQIAFLSASSDYLIFFDLFERRFDYFFFSKYRRYILYRWYPHSDIIISLSKRLRYNPKHRVIRKDNGEMKYMWS